MNRRRFVKNLGALVGGLVLPKSLIMASDMNRKKFDDYILRIKDVYSEMVDEYSIDKSDNVLILDGFEQKMYDVHEEFGKLIFNKTYLVSTARRGFGNVGGSRKTPLGVHRICAKVGNGEPIGAVFKLGKRVPDKRVAPIITYDNGRLGASAMTTRVVKINGVEDFNRNTLYRCVFIHGAQNEMSINKRERYPEGNVKGYSGGCIRMLNEDVIEFHDYIPIGTYLNIKEKI